MSCAARLALQRIGLLLSNKFFLAICSSVERAASAAASRCALFAAFPVIPTAVLHMRKQRDEFLTIGVDSLKSRGL
jgi:hypothetical protein